MMAQTATVLLHRLSLFALLLLAGTAQAQSTLAEIDGIDPREVRAAGFVLEQAGDVTITAAAPVTLQRAQPLGDAWLLNANTREVLWTLDTAENYEAIDGVRETEAVLALPAGAYEVYFASFPIRYEYEGRWEGWYQADRLGDMVRGVVDEIFGNGDRGHWREWNDWEDAYYGSRGRAAGITVRGNGRALSHADDLAEGFLRNAAFSLNSQADDRYVQQGFRVKAPVELDLYAIGEMHRDDQYDFAWIIDADTGERVWAMDYVNTEPAGGASKNRVANTILRLEPGNYAAFYVTDGSHSAQRWNAAPPYDPQFWGLTALFTDAAQRDAIERYDYEHAASADAILALRRVRDDEYRSEGFTLNKPMEVRIYALGEGDGGDMYDYGWIADARTGERVWTMEYHDTERAGGASKNRVFDDTIRLEAGSYVAHYVTDDSHAFGDWNSSPPYDQDAWGLTVLPLSEFNPRDVTAYAPSEDTNLIAHLAPVRDHARKRERFTLDRNTNVRIVAVGEGDDDEMYDYGWIEDEHGEVVWEMTYRMTDHAGGAHKNRLLDTVIALRPGTYTVYYKTDGSHAFGDWNSSPPHNPANWGITIRKAE